jgi:hypothetical protein
MQALALVRLTIPATDPETARAWWSGYAATDEDGDLVLGDVELRFGDRLTVTAVAAVAQAQETTDPEGTRLQLVPPDTESAAQAEATITGFVTSADELPGRPVAALADEVHHVLRQAREQIAGLLQDVPHNKVLATQLALGQRARQGTGAEPEWALHAASTLMSGFVVHGGSRARGVRVTRARGGTPGSASRARPPARASSRSRRRRPR